MTQRVEDKGYHATIARTFACAGDLARLIGDKAQLRDHAPRATILHGEDPAANVFLLFGGHARMIAIAAEGRMSVIEDYHTGDLFGERGLFGQTVGGHEVTAICSSTVGAFANPDFLGLMSNYSCVALAVSRILVTRLEAAQRRLAAGATLSAKGRVCAELLRLAGEERRIIPVPVLADMALSVQSTRETVSRCISMLEKRGIIRRDGTALIIVAPHRLEEMVF